MDIPRMRLADELSFLSAACSGGSPMPTLSIIIPAYNEAHRLPDTLHAVRQYLTHRGILAEVIVVDDGSTDDTAAIAAHMAGYIADLRVIRLAKNSGKGRAVQAGMLASRGDYALFMDADHSTPINEVDALLPYADTHDVIIGSRHLPDSEIVIKQPWYRVLVSRLGNAAIRLLLVRGIHDTQCGFKLFRRAAYIDIFTRQRTTGFGFDIEILSIARQLGYRVKEVPVSWYNSPESKVRPLADAWRTLKELLRITYHVRTGHYLRPQFQA